MQTLLAFLIGNLSALLVHGLAWQMRKKCLWLLVILGIFGLLAIFGIAFLMHADFNLNNEIPQKFNWMGLGLTCGVGFLLTSLCAFIQMRQIPARWWKSLFALYGEIFMWGLGGFLGSLPYFYFGLRQWVNSQVCFLTFVSALICLAFFRPFVVRWVHPIWQLMLNPGKPITEKS